MRRCRLVFAFLLSLASACPAAAQDEAARAQAREQFGLGVQRYEAGDFTAALQAFQEAYRLAPHPTVRVNMANCYEHLGRPLEAMHHFERFLAEAESASRQQRREVETAMRRLQALVGEVRLSVAPDGALVSIDSAETRRAPILEPVRLPAGTHQIEVRLDGFRTDRREIQVIGGQTARVSISLERGVDAPPIAARISEPVPASQTETPVPPENTSVRTEAPRETSAAVAIDPVEEPPSHGGGGGFELRFTTPVIIGASAAGGFTLAAVISGVVALGANDGFESAVLRSNDVSLPQAERDQAREDGIAAASQADTASIVTDIFVIGAIAAAGVGTFFLIVDGMDGESSSASAGGVRVAAAPSVGRNGGGVVVSGSF